MNNPAHFTCICLLIRDENRYLNEWLLHHLPITDHIYIYDNGIKEQVSTATSKLPKQDQSRITVIPYKNRYSHVQEEAYNHFLTHYGRETVWCIFLDSDEFLILDCPDTLPKILTEKDCYNEIRIFWNEYGADGRKHYEPLPVRQRFLRRSKASKTFLHKDFIQTAKVRRMISHFPVFDPADRLCYEDTQMKLFHIDHYYTKSLEEWQEKMARGSANHSCLKNFNEFFLYNPDMAYLKTETNGCSQSYHAGCQKQGGSL